MNELPHPYRYEKGIRLFMSGDQAPVPESCTEFIERMKTAEDISWLDVCIIFVEFTMHNPIDLIGQVWLVN